MFKINKSSVKREAREWGEALIIALILTLIIRTFVVQAFKIPSGSMYPTLMVGDKLFVNKFLYKFDDPQRWDVIVFKYPEDPKKDFIKRLIAFEGETVEIRDGGIYIDGAKQTLPEEIDENLYYNQEPFAAPRRPVKVPENSYFVLGDNSLSSRDSRYWGFVPKKYMVGKAFVRW
ncbi:MAG: signal peptidase I, partial [Candidatus Omnitrophota bacterium]